MFYIVTTVFVKVPAKKKIVINYVLILWIGNIILLSILLETCCELLQLFFRHPYSVSIATCRDIYVYDTTT